MARTPACRSARARAQLHGEAASIAGKPPQPPPPATRLAPRLLLSGARREKPGWVSSGYGAYGLSFPHLQPIAGPSNLAGHRKGRPYRLMRLGQGDCIIHDFAYLPPGRVVAGAELQAARAAVVAGDDAMQVGGL